jgi:hypothetical protein
MYGFAVEVAVRIKNGMMPCPSAQGPDDPVDSRHLIHRYPTPLISSRAILGMLDILAPLSWNIAIGAQRVRRSRSRPYPRVRLMTLDTSVPTHECDFVKVAP